MVDGLDDISRKVSATPSMKSNALIQNLTVSFNRHQRFGFVKKLLNHDNVLPSFLTSADGVWSALSSGHNIYT